MDGTGSQILQAILIVVLIVFLYSVVRYISAVLIVMYQNVNKDGMSVGGHWIQQGEYKVLSVLELLRMSCGEEIDVNENISRLNAIVSKAADIRKSQSS